MVSTAAVMSSRRTLLCAAGGAGVGLVIGGSGGALARPTDATTINPFLRRGRDGSIVVISSKAELGQGTPTALAMAVAEELDADWSMVRYEFAPADASLYHHAAVPGIQITAGSSSISTSLEQYRRAGAAARLLMIRAAAERLDAAAESLTVVAGRVRHADGRSLGFAELAEAAATLPLPADIPLKDPAAFRLLGTTRVKRLDAADKVRGRTVYTQDVRRPGMLTAVTLHPPRFGARVRSFDAAAAGGVRDVVEVIAIPQGVAVLATNTWAALCGREALRVAWDDTHAERRSSADIMAEYRALLDRPGAVATNTGNATAALRSAFRIVEADFEFPFLAHAPLEPMNAVVDLSPGERLDVWTAAQMPSEDRRNAAEAAGLDPSRVAIHTLHAGGSFGRRAVPTSDYIVEAVEIAKAIGGRAPVKLFWSRDDDMRGG
jgi:isoquinoline 1-oxidoreductase beta subunit